MFKDLKSSDMMWINLAERRPAPPDRCTILRNCITKQLPQYGVLLIQKEEGLMVKTVYEGAVIYTPASQYEWLDETEESYTVEDMENAYREGAGAQQMQEAGLESFRPFKDFISYYNLTKRKP
jgi:hypothetical protein